MFPNSRFITERIHQLNHQSANVLNVEIGGSKRCLLNYGHSPSTFEYPYDKGTKNKSVVVLVAEYHDMARSRTETITFLI